MILGFADRWPIDATLDFEREYHPNLQLSLDDKTDLLGVDGASALCVWLYNRDSNALIGESYGVAVKVAFEDGDQGAEDLEPYVGRRAPMALYCYSTTILPEFQGQGFGKLLKAYFLGYASARFDVVVGHARIGASRRLNAAFGAEFGRHHADWYGTGETYTFYRLLLRRPP